MIQSMDLSSRISEMVKEDSPENFKHIALVMIGSVQDKPSIFLGSRCLWNEATDDFMKGFKKMQSRLFLKILYMPENFIVILSTPSKVLFDFKTTHSTPSLLFTACITNKLKVTELQSSTTHFRSECSLQIC